MSTVLPRQSWAALAGGALLLTSCASSPAKPTRSAPAAATKRPAKPGAQSRAVSESEDHAGWDALVDQGEVWARPELNRFCQDRANAYFIHTTPAATYDQPEGPEAFGCKARFNGTAVEVGQAESPCGADGVAGQTYCCPEQLRSPPPPISGGGATCEQVQIDYLSEVGLDPLVVRAESSSSAGVTFDRSARVLARSDYLDACGVDPSAVIEVCAAIRGGVARGVTVCVQPPNRRAGECIARAVRDLGFPISSQLDVTETTFEPR
jgi:hypothetical protein